MEVLNTQGRESYFVVAKKKKEDRLQWLTETVRVLLEEGQYRTEQQRVFLEAYRGFDYDSEISVADRMDPDRRKRRRIKRLKINHLFDITETKVSQMTRLKSDILVLPRHNEWDDRAAAKVANAVLKNINEQQEFDSKVTDCQRMARVLGEVYMFAKFNPEIGDLHPSYIEAKDLGLTEITLPDGKKHNLDKPIRVGDVEYNIEYPWRVLLQRKSQFKDIDWAFRISIVEKDKVIKDYPETKKSLNDQDDAYIYNTELMRVETLEGSIPVYEFYHKKTEYLPNGAYIKFTDTAILEESDSLLKSGNLPFVRLTDVDFPDVLNGVSKFEFALLVQQRYDDLSTLIAKNIYLTAHAKWMLPRGAAKIEQLGNDNTIVQYSGPVAPQLVTVQPNPPEVYSFRENLKNELQVILGNSHGLSRGEIPKGITANSALQFLNELESERASTDIAKHAKFVIDCNKLALEFAADNYSITDGRLLKIVGKNNQYLIRHFDTADLSKPYDVRFENSSGFPETRAAKEQRLMDMLHRNPTMFTSERWEQLFELSDVDKAITLHTAAVNAADSENEDLLAGKPVAMPEEYEDHITHWLSHATLMQNRGFKEESSNEIYAAVEAHVRATEKFMIVKSQKYPTFAAQIANLVNFPLLTHEDYTPPPSKAQQEALVQGEANRGAPVTGMIPGQPMDEMGMSNSSNNQGQA